MTNGYPASPFIALLSVAGVLTCGAPPGFQAQVEGWTCTVQRVADGDSFTCSDGQRVRLTGIDTPELNQGELGRRSRAALLELMAVGSEVRLESDVSPRDQYRRVLAYAWRDSVMINHAMVRQGWALVYTVPPNTRYAEMLRLAQDSARKEGRGHWKDAGFTCAPERRRRREC
jgi:micrococcal nuclease